MMMPIMIFPKPILLLISNLRAKAKRNNQLKFNYNKIELPISNKGTPQSQLKVNLISPPDRDDL